MSTAQVKKSLHKYVEVLDTPFLQAIHALIKAHVEENSIIGYSADGSPISPHTLKKRVKAAQARMDSGEYISHNDVKKEASEW